MRQFITIIILVLLSLVEVKAQNNSSLNKLTIENNTEAVNSLSNSNLLSINEITLNNVTDNEIINSLKKFENLKTIIIKNSPDLNYKKLFSNLKKCKKLNHIILDGNNIIDLNSKITKIESLTKIEIKNNANLNLERVINKLKNIKSLKEVALPINEIFDIPDNISELTNITTLDLRNNYLSNLPDEISKLDSLNTLNLEENIIIDPIKTLSKLKTLNIKYLTFDKEGLSEEEVSTLKRLFPNSIIKAKERPIDELLDNVNDSTNVLSKDKTIESDSNSIFKAYSTAYLYFPYIYRDIRLSIKIDTLNLEERYKSYDYINIYPKKGTKNHREYASYNLTHKSRGYFSLKVKKDKELDGLNIYYKINKRRAKDRGIYYNNPEVNTFNNYAILYNGSLSKRQLRKLFRNQKYSDIRYYFEPSSSSFRMEIKSDSSNFSLDIQPMNRLLKTNPKMVEKTYTKLNKQYKKALKRRIKNFDRILRKQKRDHIRSKKNARNEIWRTFQKDHMSFDEKSMSKEEWIIYYEQVIANENIAINNAPISLQNIERGIELKGVLERKYANANKDSLILVYNSFFNNKEKKLKIDKYLFFDKTRNEFVSDRTAKSDVFYSNNEQKKLTKNYLYEESSYDILIQYKNGTIGIARDIKFKDTKDIQAIVIKELDKKYSSVSEIYNILGI